MTRWVLPIVTAAALVAGCSKTDSITSAASADSRSAAEEAPISPRGPGPMPDAATNTVAIDASDINVALQQLSQELRDYVVRTRTVPRNFDEFAAKAALKVPAPPAGKKFAIKGQAVVLVKR